MVNYKKKSRSKVKFLCIYQISTVKALICRSLMKYFHWSTRSLVFIDTSSILYMPIIKSSSFPIYPKCNVQCCPLLSLQAPGSGNSRGRGGGRGRGCGRSAVCYMYSVACSVNSILWHLQCAPCTLYPVICTVLKSEHCTCTVCRCPSCVPPPPPGRPLYSPGTTDPDYSQSNPLDRYTAL